MAHQYYPPSVQIPNFAPNANSLSELLPIFGGLITMVVLAAFVLARRGNDQLRAMDGFAVCWFAMCAFIHMTFEGYYLHNISVIAGQNTIYAQLWKEYALSDSRYLTNDAFTICIETITVYAWGPLCFMAAYSIIKNQPTRHFYQIVVCVAHLYGLALYFSTFFTELGQTGVSYCRPEFLYFGVYFIGFNLPWAIVPLALLYDSFDRMNKAFTNLQREKKLSINVK